MSIYKLSSKIHLTLCQEQDSAISENISNRAQSVMDTHVESRGYRWKRNTQTGNHAPIRHHYDRQTKDLTEIETVRRRQPEAGRFGASPHPVSDHRPH